MTILEAITDPQLFRPYLGSDLATWQPWQTALRCAYGSPLDAESRELVRRCTGRDAAELPRDGFQTVLFLVGRRSGKSKIAASIAVFEGLLAGREKRLGKGETGIVAIVAPTKYQASIVWNYVKGACDTPLLKRELVNILEAEKVLALRNGIEIRVLVGDYRTVRGPSIICAIIDEICFFGVTEESKVRSDGELVRAIRPALATTRGKLICIGSKYARKGWAFKQWLKQHGSNKGVSPEFSPAWNCLVWDCPSKVMNPTLSDEVIAQAYAEDPAAARSEFGGEWREDIAEYIPRGLIELLVVPGRKELLPRRDTEYVAFCDLSGGRSDAAALAIAHTELRKVILDFARVWHAPFNPHLVVSEMAEELRRFYVCHVTGDAYGAEFVSQAFQSNGIGYTKSELPKSRLYAELLPRLCSAEIELLDIPLLVDQLAGLERRTRSGGADIIDHGPNGHDDLCNVVAGVAVACARPIIRIGGMRLMAA